MYIDKDVVLREIQTNLRDESVAAPEYLLSRSVAGVLLWTCQLQFN